MKHHQSIESHRRRHGSSIHWLCALLMLASLSVAQAEEGVPRVDAASADAAVASDLDDLFGTNGEEIVFQEIPSVYGVSRFEQKITEAPSFVTLITADEITKYGYRTLAEVLQSVTGFFVTYDRNYNYLGVRGFNRPGDFNTRVLLLVDGHRLNDNIYDQAGVGTESAIDVDLIERVEVIRGPSSSIYGTNAFFGVINVITKRGRDIRGFEVSTEVGSFDSYRFRGTYGNKFSNGLEMLVSGSYYDSEGQKYLFYPEFNDPSTGNGITRRADDDMFPSLFGKFTYRDVTLEGGYISREKGIPTASYDTFFPTDRTRSTDEHYYAFLKYQTHFEYFDFSGRIYYDKFYYQGNYLYDLALAPPPSDLVLNQDRSTGEWWGAEAQFDRRFGSHNVTAGFEYRDNFRQDLWNADLNPREVFLDEKRDSWNIAAYLQDEFSILEDLILNAGVRYDYYDSFGNTVNPRVALIYNLEKTTMKALYGTAFRRANAYEGFYVGTGFAGNPDLDPEKISTYELVLERALLPYLRATIAGYFYRIDDLISQEFDAASSQLIFQNRGEIEAKGVEVQLEMDGSGPLGISGRLGYALQEAKDRESGHRLTNSPSHLINLNLTVPLFEDKLFGSAEVFYASERKTLAGDRTDHHTLTNLTMLVKNMLPGLELSASVRNVFDESYFDPGSGPLVHVQDQIEQDGRTFWLKAKFGF